jgi:hypothetical protein
MEHVIIAQLRSAEAGIQLLASLLPDLDQAKPENRIAPHAAASAAAALGGAIALLEAWGDGPTAAPDEPPIEAPPEPDDDVCRHPKERRRAIATMTHPNAWRCLACGFDHKGD